MMYMEKRYLRFQAWSAPVLQLNSEKIDCIINVKEIIHAKRAHNTITIQTTQDVVNYYFDVDAQAKQVYDELWEML